MVSGRDRNRGRNCRLLWRWGLIDGRAPIVDLVEASGRGRWAAAGLVARGRVRVVVSPSVQGRVDIWPGIVRLVEAFATSRPTAGTIVTQIMTGQVARRIVFVPITAVVDRGDWRVPGGIVID